jgi:hypothetical protein
MRVLNKLDEHRPPSGLRLGRRLENQGDVVAVVPVEVDAVGDVIINDPPAPAFTAIGNPRQLGRRERKRASFVAECRNYSRNFSSARKF